MEIYLDTANVEEIRKAAEWGVISGVTTNPTLVSKERGRDFHGIIKEICTIVRGPVSAEVISQDADGILREARDLAAIDPHVVVKIPVTPEGLSAVRILAGEGIRANVTLVFSALQALLAARAGAAFVSPFIGRIDDIGQEGMDVVEDIVRIFDNYGFGTKVIAASIRHPRHVLEAARLGADIATVPFRVLEQMFRHPLTDRGIERFLADWAKMREERN
ncbi:fructose-6-phosphate aldolase Fsa [Thermacetogenium phaeum DSM 12270]|uniref:Probable transaldolase n=1 Tax=Thermacetogenium phaeum (strain ATCC BAA-254 / DSM 26808 / PB) TaxID=1089553 RepID=K4LLH4_THEPS|nr:fructose-6-phosphate aldolase [Thermacetogenium phaeum]AFV12947.1 fructose-6-phosphate aldolase Fsa [Thermacetogenium phaeum DSM 12270]